MKFTKQVNSKRYHKFWIPGVIFVSIWSKWIVYWQCQAHLFPSLITMASLLLYMFLCTLGEWVLLFSRLHKVKRIGCCNIYSAFGTFYAFWMAAAPASINNLALGITLHKWFSFLQSHLPCQYYQRSVASFHQEEEQCYKKAIKQKTILYSKQP